MATVPINFVDYRARCDALCWNSNVDCSVYSGRDLFRSGRVFLVLTFTSWRYGSGRPIMDEFGVGTFSSLISIQLKSSKKKNCPLLRTLLIKWAFMSNTLCLTKFWLNFIFGWNNLFKRKINRWSKGIRLRKLFTEKNNLFF